MTPIEQFESSAEKAWRADITAESKSRHLLEVSQAIEHYIQRLDNVTGQHLDPWQARRVERAKTYLEGLARDTKALAGECVRAPAAA